MKFIEGGEGMNAPQGSPACTHMHKHVHTHIIIIRIHAHANTHMHKHTHAQTHTHTQTHTHASTTPPTFSLGDLPLVSSHHTNYKTALWRAADDITTRKRTFAVCAQATCTCFSSQLHHQYTQLISAFSK